jgi:hypothetical protein
LPMWWQGHAADGIHASGEPTQWSVRATSYYTLYIDMI